VSVQGSLPLYTGGKRKAERIQARESLESLKIKRASVAQKLEQRIRTASENAHATYTNISESRAAAEAAAKSLDLVTIGYGRGVVNITDLLDAQTASHSAELGASSTGYSFMLALMELYRSVAVVGFLEPTERRSQWVNDLKAWCERNAGAATTAPAMASVTDAATPAEKK
jgi:outer membrane protein TolC